MKIHSMGA